MCRSPLNAFSLARQRTDGATCGRALSAWTTRSLVVTRQEAAEALGVDPRTIMVGIEGTIPSVKIGRRIVIPREKFLALFADSPE